MLVGGAAPAATVALYLVALSASALLLSAAFVTNTCGEGKNVKCRELPVLFFKGNNSEFQLVQRNESAKKSES